MKYKNCCDCCGRSFDENEEIYQSETNDETYCKTCDMYINKNSSKTQILIKTVADQLRDLLLYKNTKYGDSALNPIKVFSSDNAEESISIRLDDKLSRIVFSSDLIDIEKKTFVRLFSRVLKENGKLRKNDVADIVGYMILLMCSKGWDNLDDLKD